MSGESISSAILTIASVICAFGFVSAVYPSVISAGDPIMSRTDSMGEQIMTDIEILHEATGVKDDKVKLNIKGINEKPETCISEGKGSEEKVSKEKKSEEKIFEDLTPSIIRDVIVNNTEGTEGTNLKNRAGKKDEEKVFPDKKEK